MRKLASMVAYLSATVLAATMVTAVENEGQEAPKKTDSFSNADTDNDGKLSLAEYTASLPGKKNVETRFVDTDTDKDGFVTKEEHTADFFKRKDTDNDGKLSLVEYTANAPDSKKSESLFKTRDTNNDGFLSLEEFSPPKARKVSSKPASKTDFFVRIDTDKDGKLSRAEHAAAFPNSKNADASFDKKDTDKDGVVSAEEYKAASAAYKLKKEAAAAPKAPAEE
jgi:Ca2+-binding EF-hand superfamily protein